MTFSAKKNLVKRKNPFWIVLAIALVLTATILPIYFLVLNKPKPPALDVNLYNDKDKTNTKTVNLGTTTQWTEFNQTNVQSYSRIEEYMKNNEGFKSEDFKKIKYIWETCIDVSTPGDIWYMDSVELLDKTKTYQVYASYLCLMKFDQPDLTLDPFILNAENSKNTFIPATKYVTIMLFERECEERACPDTWFDSSSTLIKNVVFNSCTSDTAGVGPGKCQNPCKEGEFPCWNENEKKGYCRSSENNPCFETCESSNQVACPEIWRDVSGKPIQGMKTQCSWGDVDTSGGQKVTPSPGRCNYPCNNNDEACWDAAESEGNCLAADGLCTKYCQTGAVLDCPSSEKQKWMTTNGSGPEAEFSNVQDMKLVCTTGGKIDTLNTVAPSFICQNPCSEDEVPCWSGEEQKGRCLNYLFPCRGSCNASDNHQSAPCPDSVWVDEDGQPYKEMILTCGPNGLVQPQDGVEPENCENPCGSDKYPVWDYKQSGVGICSPCKKGDDNALCPDDWYDYPSLKSLKWSPPVIVCDRATGLPISNGNFSGPGKCDVQCATGKIPCWYASEGKGYCIGEDPAGGCPPFTESDCYNGGVLNKTGQVNTCDCPTGFQGPRCVVRSPEFPIVYLFSPVIDISDGKEKYITLDRTGLNTDTKLTCWVSFNEANVKSYDVIQQVMFANKWNDFSKIKYIWDICLNGSSNKNLSTISTMELQTKNKVVAYVCNACVLSDKYQTFKLQRYELNQTSIVTLPDPGVAAIMVYEEQENN